ncbi:pre-mRNA-splicing factor 18 [Metschnikowia aff. pulcherrima]|uniref:Pre-mRNA-splicing factor 18 n=1 Tax=Metschnikowia aff. pulcherrima TaxID=2163413 RepID=A0A4P6XMJ0_9ASCO|nr:pre-mRNA-splicing factor 18 [Metschnikowia aff. pulcherrima]
MDFTKLLSKQLEQKKLQQQQAKEAKAKREKNLAESHEIASTQNDLTDRNKADEISPPNPEISAENKLLESINQEKLAQSLLIFGESGENEANVLKEEQLRKLQIHLKHEKKDEAYKEYLDRENGVRLQLQLEDIAAQSSNTLCLQIRRFFKEILQTWTESCDEEFPQSMLMETKRDIVKLLYKLRSCKLTPETVVSLSTIVFYIQTEDIVKANEAYLKLSIGNVAWPIGVRDVNIHARAADAKIAGDDKTQLANIMKSEATRRWLIAVKRIVNYCGHLHARQPKET